MVMVLRFVLSVQVVHKNVVKKLPTSKNVMKAQVNGSGILQTLNVQIEWLSHLILLQIKRQEIDA